MSKRFLSILFVLFSFNSAHAIIAPEIEENIEDMMRSRAQWGKTRTQILSSSQLNSKDLALLELLKQDRESYAALASKELFRSFNEGNLRVTMIDLKMIDQHYLNYLKHNLPQDLYGELVSRRTAFKLLSGDKLENSLKTDFEI